MAATAQQIEAIAFLDAFASGFETIGCLQGYAGVGKTWVVSHWMQTLIEDRPGISICVAAPTHKALDVLRSKCGHLPVEFKTVASLLGQHISRNEDGELTKGESPRTRGLPETLQARNGAMPGRLLRSVRPVRIIRDEHDCRTWALEQGLTMSREAFGDPPEPQAPRCPVCDGTEHTNDCELGEEMAKRQQCERELAEWRELALSQAGDAGIVARMVKAETEAALLSAEVDRLQKELDSAGVARKVADVVKRDAYRFRKLLMQGKHWLGVFRCDPDGTPSDSISADELSALLDAMHGPEMPPVPEAP